MRNFICAFLAMFAMSVNASLILDADTVETGSELDTAPLLTSLGTVSFVGEIRNTADPDLIALGSTGDVFDISNDTSQAIMMFDFDVASISFIYGGNVGIFDISAIDGFGNIVDSYFADDTGDGAFAGPVTLSGTGIRSLFWSDPGFSYAALDNILITADGVVSEPSGIVLFGFAIAGIRLARKNKKNG